MRSASATSTRSGFDADPKLSLPAFMQPERQRGYLWGTYSGETVALREQRSSLGILDSTYVESNATAWKRPFD